MVNRSYPYADLLAVITDSIKPLTTAFSQRDVHTSHNTSFCRNFWEVLGDQPLYLNVLRPQIRRPFIPQPRALSSFKGAADDVMDQAEIGDRSGVVPAVTREVPDYGPTPVNVVRPRMTDAREVIEEYLVGSPWVPARIFLNCFLQKFIPRGSSIKVPTVSSSLEQIYAIGRTGCVANSTTSDATESTILHQVTFDATTPRYFLQTTAKVKGGNRSKMKYVYTILDVRGALWDYKCCSLFFIRPSGVRHELGGMPKFFLDALLGAVTYFEMKRTCSAFSLIQGDMLKLQLDEAKLNWNEE